MTLRKPYLVFLGDAETDAYAKTAFGLRDWCGEDVIGELALEGTQVTLGLPSMSPAEAAEAGAGSLVIGIASFGGAIPDAWVPTLFAGVEAGLDLVSGMHVRLSAVPGLAEAAAARGVTLHDVRHADRTFAVGLGKPRTGKRLLTVGTDCALGKKYTALSICQAMRAQGLSADFRASGQTGIMIAGGGVAIDAVVADFIAGAAETLSPDNEDDHWDVIEGQGSLFHPAYAGVSLGLLHGSQPDALVLCHDPLRTHIEGYPHIPLPTLREAIDRNVQAARLTNPDVRCVGVALNTSRLEDGARQREIEKAEAETGLFAFDPMRDPLDPLLSSLAGTEQRVEHPGSIIGMSMV